MGKAEVFPDRMMVGLDFEDSIYFDKLGKSVLHKVLAKQSQRGQCVWRIGGSDQVRQVSGKRMAGREAGDNFLNVQLPES